MAYNDFIIEDVDDVYFDIPADFTEEQVTALLAATDSVNADVEYCIEKIRKGEFELWRDVNDYESLGRAMAEQCELPDFAYIYFDFEKFGYDIAAEHYGEFTNYGWFFFK